MPKPSKNWYQRPPLGAPYPRPTPTATGKQLITKANAVFDSINNPAAPAPFLDRVIMPGQNKITGRLEQHFQESIYQLVYGMSAETVYLHPHVSRRLEQLSTNPSAPIDTVINIGTPNQKMQLVAALYGAALASSNVSLINATRALTEEWMENQITRSFCRGEWGPSHMLQHLLGIAGIHIFALRANNSLLIGECERWWMLLLNYCNAVDRKRVCALGNHPIPMTGARSWSARNTYNDEQLAAMPSKAVKDYAYRASSELLALWQLDLHRRGEIARRPGEFKRAPYMRHRSDFYGMITMLLDAGARISHNGLASHQLPVLHFPMTITQNINGVIIEQPDIVGHTQPDCSLMWMLYAPVTYSYNTRFGGGGKLVQGAHAIPSDIGPTTAVLVTKKAE